MKIRIQYIAIIAVFFVKTHNTTAQKKDENIGTEVVNVVKTYTPSVSDAFKVKETPILDDEETTKKEAIQYTIFSFPVASTFSPNKGKASEIEKEPKQKLFQNFATLGFGNFATIDAALFANTKLSTSESIGGMFRHLSSLNNVKGTNLASNFSTTSIDALYENQQKDLNYTLNIGFQKQMYNWYGLPSEYEIVNYPTDLSVINPKQKYLNFYLGGKIAVNEGIFNDMALNYNRFWDRFGSIENQFFIKPNFTLDVLDYKFRTNLIIDYVGGGFNKDYYETNLYSMKYSFVNLGLNPNYSLIKNDWTMNLGMSFFYSANNEANKNNFYVYPKIVTTYKVVGDLMIFYAGLEGNLEQNSYRNFTNSNPFISPTIGITPTDIQFDFYAGLKGKLANYISYNVKASLLNERNKALFKSNDYSFLNTNIDGYAFGNSYTIVYDNVKTVNLFCELKAEFSKDISFAINGSFSNYKTTNQEKAWNLPSVKFEAKLEANITKNWYAGTNLFFIGARSDQQVNDLGSLTAVSDYSKTVPNYFDVNAHLGYKYNERFTAFFKANNIANQAYQKWLNYPVQGFQILIGASYKFDF